MTTITRRLHEAHPTQALSTFLQIGLSIALAVSMSGCVAFLVGGSAAVGAGATAYVVGELKSTEEMSLDEAWSRTQAAVKALEFFSLSKSKDALSAKLTARTAKDDKVQITLTKQSERLTEIRIRIGVLGNEALSRLILNKIKA